MCVLHVCAFTIRLMWFVFDVLTVLFDLMLLGFDVGLCYVFYLFAGLNCR